MSRAPHGDGDANTHTVIHAVFNLAMVTRPLHPFQYSILFATRCQKQPITATHLVLAICRRPLLWAQAAAF